MSYRNVYGTAEYDTILETLKYVLDEAYLTEKVYLYLPEGYAHDIDTLCGSSAVITDIHYDRESGLIAYGGCLWGEGPRSVMVGDFSCLPSCGYPLEAVQALIDPDYEKYSKLDFESWGGGKLSLKCGEMSVSVDVDEIKRLLRSHAGAQ